MRSKLWIIGLSALVFSLAAWGVARPALLGAQVPPVAVRLTEFQIEMPTTLPAGLTTFSVTNAGQMEHNFEIKSVLEEEDPVEEPLPQPAAREDSNDPSRVDAGDLYGRMPAE
jgi:hypothetical protein